MLHEAAPELLTVREVAERLRCSEDTVRRRVAAGELPAVRTGAGPRTPLRVKATVLDQFIYGDPASPKAPSR
jgi:excisionase family DNA binding protein